MKLAIISHTQHYYNEQQQLVGWGPTITEINHLLELFEEIYHIGVLTDAMAPKSALPYTSSSIHFIPIQKTGGNTLSDKLKIGLSAPSVLKKIRNTLLLVDYFQLRTPTGIALYIIPYLTFFSKKKGWYKYAGNWNQENAPLSYAFQRWMLKHQKRKVTINGAWKHQHAHCITFENPCLSKQNRMDGKGSIASKTKENLVHFCFVGALNQQKGLDLIINMLKELENHSNLGDFHIVGGGAKLDFYKEAISTVTSNVIIHGFLAKEEVIAIYKQCHFIVLPSESEGFPKVIGEAMNYGCVPIVSDVSCISQYILPNVNGFLIIPKNLESLIKTIKQALAISNQTFKKIIFTNFEKASLFTYKHYTNHLQQELIKNEF